MAVHIPYPPPLRPIIEPLRFGNLQAQPPFVTDRKNQFACDCFLIKVALHKNRIRNLSNSNLLENEDEEKKKVGVGRILEGGNESM